MNAEKISALTDRMYEDLKKYANRPGANMTFVSKKNAEIDQIVDFVDGVENLEARVESFYQYVYCEDLRIIIDHLLREICNLKFCCESLKSQKEGREFDKNNLRIDSPEQILAAHAQAQSNYITAIEQSIENDYLLKLKYLEHGLLTDEVEAAMDFGIWLHLKELLDTDILISSYCKEKLNDLLTRRPEFLEYIDASLMIKL